MSNLLRKQIFNIDFKPELWLDSDYVEWQETVVGTGSGSVGTTTITTGADYTTSFSVGDLILMDGTDQYTILTINATTIVTIESLIATYSSATLGKKAIASVTNIGTRDDINIIQDDVFYQPVISEADADFNGRNVISFVGEADYLKSNAFNSLFAEKTASWTVVMCFKHNILQDGVLFGVVDSSGASSDTAYVENGAIGSTTAYRALRRDDGTPTNSLDYSTRDTDTHIGVYVFDGSSETLDIWRDGAKIVSAASMPITDRLDISALIFGGYLGTGTFLLGVDAKLAEAMVFSDKLDAEQITQINSYLNSKYDVYAETETIDLFLISGQSNAKGRGDFTISPNVQVGYEIIGSTSTIKKLQDPLATADTGSAWPAFANAWYEKTGRIAVIDETSPVGGAALLSVSNPSNNWSPTGTLRATAISNWQDSIDLINASDNLQIGDVYVLWHQGESEGGKINGTTITGTLYTAALIELMQYFLDNLSVQPKQMGVFELGLTTDGTDDVGYTEIQGAQQDAADQSKFIKMVSYLQKTFVARGLMFDNVHYTQPAYDEMGTEGANNL